MTTSIMIDISFIWVAKDPIFRVGIIWTTKDNALQNVIQCTQMQYPKTAKMNEVHHEMSKIYVLNVN